MALELLGGEPSRPSSVDPKTIPLLCCICPDVPRFSDVSHLITHIASKGHLHQVAQTKLKSHTDSDSSVKLQRYDSWYRAYGIESFLVVRMNTKKAKAAAGGKQRRDSSAPASEGGGGTGFIKPDDLDDSLPDVPFFPGSAVSENNSDIVDESLVSNDSMVLKGQVWPGMGKLDLANESVRRTRNQRKPRWVVENMRKASENVGPTEVVMNSDFSVNRIKCVYDDDEISIPEDEQPPPPKNGGPKLKSSHVLTNLSPNVPHAPKVKRPKGRPLSTAKPQRAATRRGKWKASSQLCKSGTDVSVEEQQENMSLVKSESTVFPESLDNDLEYPAHTLDPLAQASLRSPSQAPERGPPGVFPNTDLYGRLSAPAYFNQESSGSLGPYPPLEGILDCENAGFVGYDPRSGMSPFANHNDEVEHGHHRNPIGHQPQAPLGQDEYSRGIDLSLDDINQSFYYDNPLVSHDRPWSNAFGSTFQQPLSPPATSMVNRDHDYHFQMGHVAHDRDDSPFRIKMEPHGGMIQGSYPPLEESTPGLPSPSMWPPQHYGSPAPRADLGPGPFALQDLNSPAI